MLSCPVMSCPLPHPEKDQYNFLLSGRPYTECGFGVKFASGIKKIVTALLMPHPGTISGTFSASLS